MTPSILLFVLLVVTLAASIVLYVACVRYVGIEAPDEAPLALFPLAAPFVAFRAGAVLLPVALGVSIVTYVLLLLGAPR